MSRIANRVIKVPEEVLVFKDNSDGSDCLYFSGPKGKSNKLFISPGVEVSQRDNELFTIATSIKDIPLAGTYNSILKGLILGVLVGYQQKMEIRGVGYKVELKNSSLVMNIGKSHSVSLLIPKELEVTTSGSKKEVLIKGIDKQEVSSFAAQIRAVKKPSAYHDKGVFYFEEKTKLKPTKSVSKK